MLSLAIEDQDPFLETVKSALQDSNQSSLGDIVTKTLMPTKHRDHFARAIDVYALQIGYCRRLLEEASFSQVALETYRAEYLLNIQADPLEKIGNSTHELSTEEMDILNNASKWDPGKTPSAVKKEWESLKELEQETPFAQPKILFCCNLLTQESFDASFLEKINGEYQSDLQKLFDEFSESFEEQIKCKGQMYEPKTKCFIDIRSTDSKNLQVEAFKQKIFQTERPIYEKWTPALTPHEVFEQNNTIEEILKQASIACTTLTESTAEEIYEQTQIHRETRKKIFEQWSLQKSILHRQTFSVYQIPYYNLVKQGTRKPLIKRFEQDKIKRKDRLNFLKKHAPEILHIACANNQLNILQFLIEKIRMPQLRNEAGYYPIHYAVIGSRQGERPVCLNYLLTKGGNVNARGPFAYTPLHVAVMYGRLDLVDVLYQQGAHVDGIVEAAHFHVKPIHLAATRGEMGIVAFLITHGANPFVLNQERHSPLVEAILENNKTTIMTFFRHGIWLNASDRALLTEHLESTKSLSADDQQILDNPSSSDKPPSSDEPTTLEEPQPPKSAFEKMPEEKITSLLALSDNLIIDERDRSVLLQGTANSHALSLDNYLKGIWDLFYIDSKILMVCTVQETCASKLLNTDSFDPDIIKTMDHQYTIMIKVIPDLVKVYKLPTPSQSHIKNHKRWCLPSTPNTARIQIDAYEKECSDTVIITLQTPSDAQAIASASLPIAPASPPYQIRESQADPYEIIQQRLLTDLLEDKSFSLKAIEDVNQEYRKSIALLEIPADLALPEGFDIAMTFGAHLTPKWVLDFVHKAQETLRSIQRNCDKLFVRASNLKFAFDLGTSESFLLQQQEKGEISQNKHPDYYKLFRLCVEQDSTGIEVWNRDWQDHLLEACPKAFHIVCANNTLELAGYLLESIPNIPMLPDEYGRYPIHYAMLLTDILREDFIQRLINRGADINAIDDAFWTPMHLACARGDLDLVKLLVTLGASLQGLKGYDTPLHVAASRNRPAVVCYLLEQPPEKKVDVSALNQNGHTPVGAALLEGHLNIVNLFIKQEHYLSVQDIHAKDNSGSTAAHVACARGDLGLLKFLVGYDAPLQEANKDFDTPLHVAAFGDKPDVVCYLLAQGVDIHPLNQMGHTPLVSGILEGHLDIAKVFSEQGYWLRPEDKAILVAYLEHIAPIVCDSNLMAVIFKNISRCVTLEREVMRLIGCELSPHPSLEESHEVLVPQPVSSDLETPSIPPNSPMQTQVLVPLASETDTTAHLPSGPITYADQATALLYAAGATIMAHVPAAPTMPAALQTPLHYLYRSAIKPAVLTNSSNTTPPPAFSTPLP